ncbi:hypothetical protein EG327_007264 [Venturia inaequalis]|uniref:Uncharacterized protein n=1 Tax=Venturia inaequalis TaxID=5025 RepID=A0A8H3YYT4_VENIN|nr:hypothetical protein EG327_007264 [Venturia inaequalis]
MASQNQNTGGSSDQASGNSPNSQWRSWERQEERKVNEQQASFAQQAAVARHNFIYPVRQNHHIPPHQRHGAAFLPQQFPVRNPPLPSQPPHYGTNPSFPRQNPPFSRQLPIPPKPIQVPNNHEIEYLIDVFVGRGFQDYMLLLGYYQHNPSFMVALAHTVLNKYKDSKIKIDQVVTRLRLKKMDEQSEEDTELIDEIIGVLTRENVVS